MVACERSCPDYADAATAWAVALETIATKAHGARWRWGRKKKTAAKNAGGWLCGDDLQAGAAFAVAFVFGPGGQDCGGIHGGKLL